MPKLVLAVRIDSSFDQVLGLARAASAHRVAQSVLIHLSSGVHRILVELIPWQSIGPHPVYHAGLGEEAREALEARGAKAQAISERCKALALRASDALQNPYTTAPWRLFSQRLAKAAPAAWGALDTRWRLAPAPSLTERMIAALPEMASSLPGWSAQNSEAVAGALARGRAEVASFVEATELRESIAEAPSRLARRSRSL